jgi:Protein of unknown function (DUF3261)
MNRRTLALVLALLLAFFAVPGCMSGEPRRSAQHARAEDYPGELLDSTALPDGLFLRQRIEARFGERELAFSAVLQTADGVLSLLALTPYGTRAFLLEQRGQAVSFTSYVERALPFPPRFILIDVQRTLFLGLPGAPLPDGDHTGVHNGERITERWHGSRLLARSFERLGGGFRGPIRITYPGGMRGTAPPRRIELDNAWFGYQLTIHTLASD